MHEVLFRALQGIKIDDLTVSNLDDLVKNSFVNKSAADLWNAAAQLNTALVMSRTYATLPIPGTEAIATNTFTGAGQGTLQPGGSEVFDVYAISATNNDGANAGDLAVQLTDGVTGVILQTQSIAALASATVDLSGLPRPLRCLNGLYLAFTVTGDTTDLTVSTAYAKCSL